MTELKPCPFCGGKANFAWIADEGTEATCVECHCGTLRYFSVSVNPDTEKEMATQVWNKRTPGWISVDDRLPKDEERILIFVALEGHESVQLDTCYEDCGYMHLDSGYAFGAEVTHWMPLPEPPRKRLR